MEQTKGAKGGDGGPVSLTVDHVLSSFYILALGLVISTICFIVELCKAKSTSWYNKRFASVNKSIKKQ